MRIEIRRIESGAWIGERAILLAAVENAVTRAQSQFAGDLVGQANARGKVIEIGANQSARSGALNGEFGAERGGERGVLPLGNDERLAEAKSNVACP